MSKKGNKLREALGNLFKARGEFVDTTKISQQKNAKKANQNEYEKGQLNGGIKDKNKEHKEFKENTHIKNGRKVQFQNDSVIEKKNSKKNVLWKSNKEASKKINGDPVKDSSRNVKNGNDLSAHNNKPKGHESKEKMEKQKNMVNNKNKKKHALKTMDDKSTRTKASSKKANIPEDIPKRPPGYFVMNHNAPKSNKNLNQNENPKTNVKKNKKLNKQQDDEIKNKNNKPAKQANKRKANKDNGPQSKLLKNQNGHFNSEELSDNTDAPVEESNELSEFRHSNDDFDEMSFESYTDDTDATDDYSESYDDETLSDDYDSDYFFESDDLDDTYSEQSESSLSISDSFDSIHDPDYELPKSVPEDHIIHQGLAVKHEFKADYDIQFNEHDESAQIVELPNEVKNVEQHKSLNVEHLRTLELNYLEKVLVSLTSHADIKDVKESEECPQLVPIDDVDFRLWTSGIEMDDEIFSECTDHIDESDESSITAAEGNINYKYMKKKEFDVTDSEESMEEEEDAENIDELPTQKKKKNWNMKADVIVAHQQQLAAFNVGNPENEQLNEESSLSEIIAQTQKFFDTSKIVIKTAIVNEATLKTNTPLKQNMLLEEVELMRSLANSPFEELQDSENAVFSPNVNEKLMDDSVVDNDSPMETPTAMLSDEYITSTPPQPKNLTESNPTCKFKTMFFDSIDSHNVLVLLKSAFYVYGTVKVTLIAGAAEIFGYKLQKLQTRELYSPRGVCALQISPQFKSLEAVDSSLFESKEDILATIGTFGNECEFNVKQLEKLLAEYVPSTDAILLLTRNDDADNIKNMLQLHVKENIFPAQIPLSRQFYSSEFLLDCMININTEYPLHILPQWRTLRLEANSKLLLVGGKSVGKSTLLRFLVNQHLNKFPAVLVIDLDIGQPEIFASQAVSCALIQQPLLGPGFFYNIQPDKAYCVAHSNVVVCAHRYMPAVLELLQFCKEEPRYQNIPCIVNTMGYNKGFGTELIAVISEHLRPTDIVQFQSRVPINNFDCHFEPYVISTTIERNFFNKTEYAPANTTPLNHRLHLWPSAIMQQSRFQREWQMSAKDMRYVMLLTQLSQILNENSEILNQKQTYCINMDALTITNPLSKRATAIEVAKSLVSNLVYLGHNETKSTELKTIECYGIGIVRAIDWPVRQLYLLTALPLERLKGVNALTPGDMPLPASMLTLQNLVANVNVPFVQNVADEATSRSIRQFYSRT